MAFHFIILFLAIGLVVNTQLAETVSELTTSKHRHQVSQLQLWLQ